MKANVEDDSKFSPWLIIPLCAPVLGVLCYAVNFEGFVFGSAPGGFGIAVSVLMALCLPALALYLAYNRPSELRHIIYTYFALLLFSSCYACVFHLTQAEALRGLGGIFFATFLWPYYGFAALGNLWLDVIMLIISLSSLLIGIFVRRTGTI